MSTPGSRSARFVLWASLVAAASLILTLALVPAARGAGLPWFLLGWALMAAISVASGGWMVRRHGTEGSGFLVALGAGMAGRLVGALAGGVAAGLSGETAPVAYIVGLAAGFVPQQVFEMVWFGRRNRNAASASVG